MELALGGVPALGVEEEGFVVDGRVGFALHGDRAAEDGELVLRGKAGEQLDHTGRLTGEIADRPPEVPEGQELDRKILGEDEELALVIRGRFNQCGHLVG
ncbi:MAG TPA: hypothetical protein VFO14_09630 [Vicinamibacterales bacterium]|nr:hypothetical protein [Vicinamibacterales bacterium]